MEEGEGAQEVSKRKTVILERSSKKEEFVGIPIQDKRIVKDPVQEDSITERLQFDNVNKALESAHKFLGDYAQAKPQELSLELVDGKIGEGTIKGKVIELQFPKKDEIPFQLKGFVESGLQGKTEEEIVKAAQELAYALGVSTTLHEGVHGLLDSKPDSMLARDFEKVTGLPNGLGKRTTLLDEGIAYAVQGLYSPEIKSIGSLAPVVREGEKIEVATRKKLGEALRPKVKEYIETDKKIDDEFLLFAGQKLESLTSKIEEAGKGKITRRDFLKAVAIAVGGLVVNKYLGEIPFSPEKPKNEILLLDIFGGEIPVEKETNETKKILINAVADNFRDHGINVDQVRKKAFEEFNSGQKDTSLKDSITGAVSFGEITYDYLGNPSMVMRVDDKAIAAKIAGSSSRIVSMSFEMGKMEVKREINYLGGKEIGDGDIPNRNTSRQLVSRIDENGNTREEATYYYDGKEISKEKYEELQRQEEERVVKTIKSEDQKFVFKDAYGGPDTYNNLSLMSNLARKFPEKYFIAACGNPYKENGQWISPDIVEAKQKLMDERRWPDNLIMVGVLGFPSVGVEGFAVEKVPFAYGADIYVNSDDLYGYNQAASFATPIVSEVVRKIIALGETDTGKIREILDSITDEVGDNKRRVLNKEKFISYIGGLEK